MFDKSILKNKDKIKELKEDLNNRKIFIQDLPKDVLLALFDKAIDKLDEWENLRQYGCDCNDDERDAFDLLDDKSYIIDNLFEELQNDIEIGLYETE